MPIDDLDQLLAMELRGSPEAEKADSLEAQVLSRVQKSRPQPERAPTASTPQTATEAPEALIDPIYQYAEALLPIIDTVQKLLADTGEAKKSEELALLRTQLAEKLLALPEVETIGKPGIFAALAMCIDAAGSGEAETRRAASERLTRLTSRLESARAEAHTLRLRVIDHFLNLEK